MKKSVKLTKPANVAKKPARPQKIHVRSRPAKDADTLCGGSHSDLWNRSGDRPLETVGPQQAGKGTCGRCIRVAKSKDLI